MIFISAGHHLKDPGASGNGHQENQLTIVARDAVTHFLQEMGVKYITDKDTDTLAQYLYRIQTGTGSVVLEYHFDSADNRSATGTTGLVGDDADRFDRSFMTEITNSTAETLGIRNRGVISEAQSHRGRLGIMREMGIVGLLEIGFISREGDGDVQSFLRNKEAWAKEQAEILWKYERMFQ